jgi:hypothetical protein
VKYFFYHKLQLSPFASQNTFTWEYAPHPKYDRNAPNPSTVKWCDVTTVKMAHSKMTFFSNQTVKINPVFVSFI